MRSMRKLLFVLMHCQCRIEQKNLPLAFQHIWATSSSKFLSLAVCTNSTIILLRQIKFSTHILVRSLTIDEHILLSWAANDSSNLAWHYLKDDFPKPQFKANKCNTQCHLPQWIKLKLIHIDICGFGKSFISISVMLSSSLRFFFLCSSISKFDHFSLPIREKKFLEWKLFNDL